MKFILVQALFLTVIFSSLSSEAAKRTEKAHIFACQRLSRSSTLPSEIVLLSRPSWVGITSEEINLGLDWYSDGEEDDETIFVGTPEGSDGEAYLYMPTSMVKRGKSGNVNLSYPDTESQKSDSAEYQCRLYAAQG